MAEGCKLIPVPIAFNSREESKMDMLVEPSKWSWRARTSPPIPPPIIVKESDGSICGIFRVYFVMKGDIIRTMGLQQ